MRKFNLNNDNDFLVNFINCELSICIVSTFTHTIGNLQQCGSVRQWTLFITLEIVKTLGVM